MNNETSSPKAPSLAKTFPQLLRAAAAAYGDDPAIVLNSEAATEQSLSFSQLNEQSARLAQGLISRGVGKGSRIGFILGNGPLFAVTLAAIARIGAIAIPISTLLKSNELVRVLRQSDASGLIVQRNLLGKDLLERLCEALPELSHIQSPELALSEVPYLRWIVSSGDALPAAIQPQDWLTAAADKINDTLLDAIEAQVYPSDQVIEIYTSGSMALPKGVKHNHGPLLARTHFVLGKLNVERGQQLPVALPMFWVGGIIMSLMPNLAAGATSICGEKTLSNSRVAMGSVHAEDDMIKYPEGMTIWALGMTETVGPYSYADVARVPGYPLCPPLDHIADGFEVRIADHSGKELPEGETGEIQVRGYALTPGLHKLERDDYFTADGFYHTGDLGVAEGSRILFVGRDGDMIKCKSSNVSPAEVELELQQLEGVHSAYVVGVPDAIQGQMVVAAIVPREGVTPDAAQLQATLRQRLSGFKVPQQYVFITREEVPMLPSNKVSRREIERMMRERLGIPA